MVFDKDRISSDNLNITIFMSQFELTLKKSGARLKGCSNMRLTAAVTKEGTWYVARCLEVEVTSQGVTMDEALENLREALELYFDDDAPIEPINSPIIAPLDVEIKV
jgi:predicted RNase H-like HicB family nuclease